MAERNRCKKCGNLYVKSCASCAKKGKKNPMYGRIYPRSLKGKNNPRYIDGRSLKKTYCKDCGKLLKNYRVKRCQSCAVRFLYKSKKLFNKGKHNPNWKGGLTSKEHKFYNSKKWKKTSQFILKRDNYICKNCKKSSNGDLQVHHKIYVSKIWKMTKKFQHLLYAKHNLITLCNKCHKTLHELEKRIYKNGTQY